MQIGVLGDMGVVYSIIGDNLHALESYKRSLKMVDSVSKAKNATKDIQDTLQTAGLLLNIGDVYLTMSQPEKALEYYDQVWQLSIAIKDLYFQIAGLTGVGKTFKLKSNFQKRSKNTQ